jgi:hypothetical protein
MARGKKTKRRYSGIKAYFPRLSFDEWLGICRRGDHLTKDRYAVISRVNWKKC